MSPERLLRASLIIDYSYIPTHIKSIKIDLVGSREREIRDEFMEKFGDSPEIMQIFSIT